MSEKYDVMKFHDFGEKRKAIAHRLKKFFCRHFQNQFFQLKFDASVDPKQDSMRKLP